MPGYQEYKLYPGPDLDKAKQLIAEANPADRDITVWTDDEPDRKRIGEYYHDLLTQLGFNATLKVIAGDVYWTTIGNQSTPDVDTGFADWFQDFPHPDDFFRPLLHGDSILPTNGNNLSRANIPANNAKMDELLTKQITDEGVEQQYADLDRAYMEQAVWAPYGNEQFTTFLSERMDFDKSYHHLLFNQDLLLVRAEVDRRGRPRGTRRATAARRTCPSRRPRAASPWYLAWLRLRRNKVALGCGVLFVLVVLLCLAAPLWAQHVAHTGPNDNHITDTIVIDGVDDRHRRRPTARRWGRVCTGRYLLGADQNGRDVMVRLLYGGRTSIYIGLAAAAVTTVLAVVVALLAGYYRGWIDAAAVAGARRRSGRSRCCCSASRWAPRSPIGGLKLGVVAIAGDSIWIPILIIGLVYVPYMARPLRGEILALREKEFVEAAVAQGMGPLRIMFGELLPNIVSTIIVFFTLNIANNMLLESALSLPRRRGQAAERVLGHDDRRRLPDDLHRTASDRSFRA